MFTGIVEGTGRVVSRETRTNSSRLVVEAGELSAGVRLGDSIAHNGCCLTVVDIASGQLSFDLLHETEVKTNLRTLQPGALINLERSLRADARLGGHFVTGHIDTTGTILKWELVGQDYELVTSFPREFGRYLIPKGCIAVDGMSLTVAEVTAETFSLWIIPHTLEVTCLKERKVGDLVNLEFDLLAKYTEKILSSR